MNEGGGNLEGVYLEVSCVCVGALTDPVSKGARNNVRGKEVG